MQLQSNFEEQLDKKTNGEGGWRRMTGQIRGKEGGKEDALHYSINVWAGEGGHKQPGLWQGIYDERGGGREDGGLKLYMKATS